MTEEEKRLYADDKFNYKEKYMRALEKARFMHEQKYTDSFTKGNLEEIFPELREKKKSLWKKSTIYPDVPFPAVLYTTPGKWKLVWKGREHNLDDIDE